MSKPDPDRSPPDGWPSNPEYVIDFDPLPARVQCEVAGRMVADSRRARVMYELGHAPVYYLPGQDIDASLLEATRHTTYCPYKGRASYWTVRAGDVVVENAIWGYPTPHAQVAFLEDYRGFYWGRMDRWLEDGEPVGGPREIPGRIDTTNQLKALYPELAREWHPEKNAHVSPYEFAPYSNAEVWWRDAAGREWRERIKDRVLAMDRLRADGDATPYG